MKSANRKPDAVSVGGRSYRPLPSLEYLMEALRYNAVDGTLVWSHRPLRHFTSAKAHKAWNKRYPGNSAGHTQKNGKKTVCIDGTSYLASRICWSIANGMVAPIGKDIDHINGDHSFNASHNLRLATAQENIRNAIYTKSASGIKGVYRGRNLWVAQIKINGKSVHIGSYLTIEEAAEARAREEIRVFGDRSSLRRTAALSSYTTKPVEP